MESARKDRIAAHYQGGVGNKYTLCRNPDAICDLESVSQSRFLMKYLRKDMKVLDFGCANVSLASEIKSSAASIDGLDVSSCKRNHAFTKNHISVFASLDEIPSDRFYDAVVLTSVVERVPNALDTLSAIGDRLVDGGLLIAVLPTCGELERLSAKLGPASLNCNLQPWTPLLFRNALMDAGFMPKELQIMTKVWTPRLNYSVHASFQSVVDYLLAIVGRRRPFIAVAVKGV